MSFKFTIAYVMIFKLLNLQQFSAFSIHTLEKNAILPFRRFAIYSSRNKEESSLETHGIPNDSLSNLTSTKRRFFFFNAITLVSVFGSTSSSIPNSGNSRNANAIEFKFFQPATLLRTKTLTSISTNNNILVSPGAGTDIQSISYPVAFVGRWNLTSTFKERTYPLGERFVPRRIRNRGSLRRDEDVPGDSISYVQEYEGDPKTNKIFPNREFNIQQQVNAQRGYEEVAEVKYDLSKQRITIFLNTLGPDMQPLPPGRNEIFITNHGQEYSVEGDEKESSSIEDRKVMEKDLQLNSCYHFTTMEFYRTITLGVRSTAVLETATYFTYDIDPDRPNKIIGKQRICLFLPPLPSGEEGDLYFEAKNRAVAVYDYDILMKRASA